MDSKLVAWRTPQNIPSYTAPPFSLSRQWLHQGMQNFPLEVSIRNWRTPDGFYCYMKPVVLARFLLENTALHPHYGVPSLLWSHPLITI